MSHEYLDMTEPELAEHMKDLAAAIDILTPENTAFVVLTTPFMSSAPVQYVSNADKDSIKEMLDEIRSRWGNDPSHVERNPTRRNK